MTGGEKTGFDRYLDDKLADPEWAAGYEAARERMGRLMRLLARAGERAVGRQPTSGTEAVHRARRTMPQAEPDR